jgi:hypothetical protein
VAFHSELEAFFAYSVPSPVENLHGGPGGWQDQQLPDGTIVRSWNGFIA